MKKNKIKQKQRKYKIIVESQTFDLKIMYYVCEAKFNLATAKLITMK